MTSEYTVRAPTMADLDAVVSVVNAYEMANEGRTTMTAAEMRAGWTSPKFNLAEDAWLAVSPAGELAGYAECRELETAFIESDGYVHPDHEGRGVGTELVRRIEWRAHERALLAGHSDVKLSAGLDANNARAVDLFEARGFTPARYFIRERLDLAAPPPTPVWPAGVSLRVAVGPEDIDRVFDPVIEIFKDHWGHRRQVLSEWRHSWIEGGYFDPSMWFIAEADGEVVGISLCREFGGIGEVTTLGVTRPWRKQGLAMALLHHSFADFRRRGYGHAELSVDSENLTGATRLYERAGMTEVLRFVVMGKPIL